MPISLFSWLGSPSQSSAASQTPQLQQQQLPIKHSSSGSSTQSNESPASNPPSHPQTHQQNQQHIYPVESQGFLAGGYPQSQTTTDQGQQVYMGDNSPSVTSQHGGTSPEQAAEEMYPLSLGKCEAMSELIQNEHTHKVNVWVRG